MVYWWCTFFIVEKGFQRFKLVLNLAAAGVGATKSVCGPSDVNGDL